jgi:hypothetical protein
VTKEQVISKVSSLVGLPYQVQEEGHMLVLTFRSPTGLVVLQVRLAHYMPNKYDHRDRWTCFQGEQSGLFDAISNAIKDA